LSKERKALGDLGEALAENFLKRKGYRILHKKFMCKLGEIDLVAKDGTDIVFIEVRMRRSARYGSPLESVLWKKQKKLLRLAHWYIKKYDLENTAMRFDIVGITGDKGCMRVDIIKDAFWEP
jgi:putative endonuclease